MVFFSRFFSSSHHHSKLAFDASSWLMYRNFSHCSQIHGRLFCSHHLLTFFLSLELELVCVSVFTYGLDFLNLPNLANPTNVSQCPGFPSGSRLLVRNCVRVKAFENQHTSLTVIHGMHWFVCKAPCQWQERKGLFTERPTSFFHSDQPVMVLQTSFVCSMWISSWGGSFLWVDGC